MQNSQLSLWSRSRLIASGLLMVAILHPIEVFAVQCQNSSMVCVDSTPCKQISGVTVCLSTVPPEQLPPNALQSTQPCWQSSGTYQCADPTSSIIDTCGELSSNPLCGKIGAEAISTDSTTGAVTSYLDTYQCQTGGGQSLTQTDCSGQTFCSDGTCYVNRDGPNDGLPEVVTAIEVGRMAGFYMDPATQTVFKGEGSWCTKNTLGLANCCKPDEKAKSYGNAMLINELIKGGWNAWAGQVAGSTYTFDTLLDQAAGYVDKAINGMAELLNINSVVTGKSITGASPAAVTAPPGASIGGAIGGMLGQIAGSTLVQNNGGNFIAQGVGGAVGYYYGTIGGTYVAAGAYAFVTGAGSAAAGTTAAFTAGGANGIASLCMPCLTAVLVFQLIMAFLACDIPEVKTQMKLGAGICHYVGSYCSAKWWYGCLTMRQQYCCFNSKLAKIIQEQGRPQIPRAWGSAQSPDCSGITIDELQALDFSQMDLSEFFNDIAAKATPDAAQIAADAQEKVKQFYANTPVPTATYGVIPPPEAGVPQEVIIDVMNPAPEITMPACDITLNKQPQDSNGNQAGSFSISSCLLNGIASFVYTGDCATLLTNTAVDMPLDDTGAGTFSTTVPSTCSSSFNIWSARIIDPVTGNMPGKVNAQW